MYIEVLKIVKEINSKGLICYNKMVSNEMPTDEYNRTAQWYIENEIEVPEELKINLDINQDIILKEDEYDTDYIVSYINKKYIEEVQPLDDGSYLIFLSSGININITKNDKVKNMLKNKNIFKYLVNLFKIKNKK